VTTHALFPLSEIAPGTARRVEVGPLAIAVVRVADDVYAIGDTCSHADVSLSEGFVESGDCMIECVRHGSLFDLKTGEPESLPAVRPVPVYEVEVVAGQVTLRLNDAEESQA
jgi:3-phenylpropionate/trans-cinnamate dioxygenase ferredoxin subunit